MHTKKKSVHFLTGETHLFSNIIKDFDINRFLDKVQWQLQRQPQHYHGGICMARCQWNY